MQFKLICHCLSLKEFYCETFNIKKKVEKNYATNPHLIITQILLLSRLDILFHVRFYKITAHPRYHFTSLLHTSTCSSKNSRAFLKHQKALITSNEFVRSPKGKSIIKLVKISKPCIVCFLTGVLASRILNEK